VNKKFILLRELYQNNTDKNKICFTYNITFSEYEKLLLELKNTDQYVNKENNTLTESGIKYLNEHKVERAVILASGLGKRMGDASVETSKCLLKVKNEVLVERLITQLKEKGIDDIVVLVGYVKEQFYYLKDKYNVTLVENKDFRDKNTIASFYNAISYLQDKNTYIVVGDIYLEKNIFNKYEIDPYYLGVWLDDCTGEWIFNYDDDCKVSGVTLNGMYDYFLGGFSFHTKDFINKLIELVKIRIKEENSSGLYWEEVLVENFDKLPDFFIRKIHAGILYEFDTQEDLDKIKDDSVLVKSKLKEVFEIKNDNFSLEKISEGINNNTYLLNYDNKKYIVRKPGVATGIFIDRKKEKEIYDVLNKTNLADKVVYFDEETGFKITEYYENSKTVNPAIEAELRDALKAYKQLHCLNLKVNKDINIVNVLKDYIDIMKKQKISFFYGNFEDILEKCNKISIYIKKFNRPSMLTHGDAGHGNVLCTGDGTKIIDFEFAGMADPVTDIALFGVFDELDINKILDLFDIYKNIKVDNEEVLKLDSLNPEETKNLLVSYIAIDAIACVVWNLIKTTVTGKYLDGYSERRLQLFDNCIKYLAKVI
jgi:CTP:phosphocholine cytidylyltransferase-like protein/thiamine kinase-like enzyme